MTDSIRRNRFDSSFPAVALILALLLVVTPGASLAQAQSGSPPGEATTKPEEPSGPQPYPVADISIEAEATGATLRRLAGHAAPDEAVATIHEAIPAKLEQLDSLKIHSEALIAAPISIRDLEDLQRAWNRSQEMVNGWQETVSRRARELDGDLSTLQTLRLRWELTRQAAIEAELTEALISVIDGALSHIQATQKTFGDRRATVLAAQEQIQSLFDIINPGLRMMTEAQSSESFDLFSFEAPPLWDVLLDSATTTDYAGQLHTVWAGNVQQLREFAADSKTLLLSLAFLFVALVGLLIYGRGQLGKLSPDIPHLDATTRILAHPVSTALVLSITSALLLFPEFPRIVGSLILVTIFVPLFRILPGELLRHRLGLIVAVFALFVLNRFVDALPYLSSLQRILLLAVSVAAFFILRYAVRTPSETESEDSEESSRVALGLARIGMVLLVTACVLNVIGNVGLANVISDAVIIAGFITVILVAAYLSFRSFLWIALNSRQVRELRMVQRHDVLLGQRILMVVRVALVAIWVSKILALLQIRTAVFGGLWSFLTAEARFGEVGISLADVLTFVITIWAAVLISRFIRFALEEDIYWRLKLPRGAPHAFSTGLHYIILLAAFFLAIAAAGVELSKLTILAGAFGVGIGFGLQDVVNNFISGLILIVERPILPGDTVQIGELTGNVKRIGMRSSAIRTWEGAEVIVPNGNLISKEVINWTLSDRVRRVSAYIGVAYGTDPTTVMDLLVATAKANEQVLTQPAPQALFLGFGDSSLDFELRVWTSYDRFLRTKSEVTVAVEKAIKDAGITIPFPQRDLHVKSVTDEARGVMPEARDDKAS